VEWLAPSETKEEAAHRIRVGDVRIPVTLGSSPAPTKRRIFIVCILLCVMMWKRRLMVVHLDRLADRATERKVRPITGVTSTALGKEMAVGL
jgi:hypothetical protein